MTGKGNRDTHTRRSNHNTVQVPTEGLVCMWEPRGPRGIIRQKSDLSTDHSAPDEEKYTKRQAGRQSLNQSK